MKLRRGRHRILTASGAEGRRLPVVLLLLEPLPQPGVRLFEIALTFRVLAQSKSLVEQSEDIELMRERVVLFL